VAHGRGATTNLVIVADATAGGIAELDIGATLTRAGLPRLNISAKIAAERMSASAAGKRQQKERLLC